MDTGNLRGQVHLTTETGLWNESLDWCTGCCCLVSCHLCGCTVTCLMVEWGKQLGRWEGCKQKRERINYNLPGPLHLLITISDGENLKLTTALSFVSTKFHGISLLANSTLRTYKVLVLENMISILTKLTLVKSSILPNLNIYFLDCRWYTQNNMCLRVLIDCSCWALRRG